MGFVLRLCPRLSCGRWRGAILLGSLISTSCQNKDIPNFLGHPGNSICLDR